MFALGTMDRPNYNEATHVFYAGCRDGLKIHYNNANNT